MTYDLIISGGIVATAADTFSCDVGINDGRIVSLGHDLGTALRIIDATGHFVLPGGIDSHVHIAQPSGPKVRMADDFASGTRSAMFGGNTTIMPFCLQEKGQTLRAAIDAYHAKANGQCLTDISFHMIITDPTAAVLGEELPALISDGYKSIKVFMTYEAMRLNDAQILATMDAARQGGAVVMVHAENEDVIRYLTDQHERAGRTAPQGHASSRPVAAEREATHRAMSLAEVVDVPVVIVHVSNGATIDEIARAKRRGQPVTAETCPQYLMLTADDLDSTGWEGAKFVCSPPPRDRAEQDACWKGLQTGVFDLFSSDHCPFRFDDKEGKKKPDGESSFRHIPNGIPGVETRLPILFSEGVTKGRIDINRFVALTATNHAKTYGLYPQKGTIAIGSDADLTIWDPKMHRTIRHAAMHDGCDYTPYEGLEVIGWPVTVILRGEVMVENEICIATAGTGRYVRR